MTSDDHQPATPGTGASERSGASLGGHAIPSRKVLGLLVAGVFAAGLIAGAALGPAPSSSLAENSTILQRAIALLAAQAAQDVSASPAASAATSQATAPASATGRAKSPRAGTTHKAGSTDAGFSSSNASPSSTSGAGSSLPPAPSSEENEAEKSATKPVRLPPIQHVWSIELAGSTLAAAEATPASYPYLVGQLIPKGVLLTNYTALDAYELAGDATLLPGGVGAGLDTISEPVCPTASPAQTAAGCPAAAGPQPGPAETDAFLQRLLTPILTSPAYSENGLIVISIAPSSSDEGVQRTTFSLQPTAGALLLSPLLHGGARNASAFDSLSPRASVAAIFEH